MIATVYGIVVNKGQDLGTRGRIWGTRAWFWGFWGIFRAHFGIFGALGGMVLGLLEHFSGHTWASLEQLGQLIGAHMGHIGHSVGA